MYAAVDLGSNSFRLHIGKHDGEAIRVVKSARAQIRLAAGLDGEGNLTPQAIEAALEALRGFGATIASHHPDAVRIVGTNTMRIAKNAAAFLAAAEQAVGYPIEIISGEEEGRLIYMGVANFLATPGERRLVADIGGGSTELCLGRGLVIERVESFSVGTVRHGSTFFVGGKIDTASFDTAVLAAASHFKDGAPPFRPENWKNAYGSSGTIRTIADMICKNNLGDGLLSQKSLEALKWRFIQFGQLEKIDLAGLRAERAGTILGGLAILIGLFKELDIEVMTPIEAGLRMGVMWDLHLRATKRDRRDQSVRACMEKFRCDGARAQRVVGEAAALFAQLKPVTDVYGRLLHWGAQLHEVGTVVSPTDYHKHGAYMMEHADLPGFTSREQRTMSKLILCQKGNLRKAADMLGDPDFLKAVLALRLAVMFLHSHVDVDFSDLKLRMKSQSRIELELKGNWLGNHPTVSFWMEKECEWWDGVGIEFLVRKVA